MKKYSGSLVVDAPLPLVWDYVLNPRVLGEAMPDVVEYAVDGSSQVKAKVHVAVGPVHGVMNMTAEIVPDSVPHQALWTISGTGMGNVLQLTGVVRLSPVFDEGDKTQLNWDAEVTMSGSLATLGFRLVDSQVKKIAEQVFENIRQGIKGKSGAL
ncbi:MAG: carbon monoxide dehydrogenase [Sulfobacillus acidophilus]|uniref:Carbon monoxide dehydrogenase n=1 Tax=Sulfobacillus acidophilus TaxID=53633 RepID=A0A2T2WIF0_9FIRM|nr:MAG: carbon monoxide dehydrogenase [Sulfobacillus acidophilus]